MSPLPSILTALRTALTRTGGGAGKTLKNVGKTAGKGSIFGGAAAGGKAGLVGAGTIASKLIPGKTELPEQQTVTTTVEKTEDKQDNEKLLNDAVEAVSETRKLNEEATSSIEPGLNL